MRAETGPAAIFVNGTVGAGRSTAAETVGRLLAVQDVPYAVVDLDALRRVWPAPPTDPFNDAVELENREAAAATYRRAGARRLILAGVLEQPRLRNRYAAARGCKRGFSAVVTRRDAGSRSGMVVAG